MHARFKLQHYPNDFKVTAAFFTRCSGKKSKDHSDWLERQEKFLPRAYWWRSYIQEINHRCTDWWIFCAAIFTSSDSPTDANWYEANMCTCIL